MNELSIRADFASAVKRSRHRLGFSQEQLAERSNLHRTYISDIERGARNLSLESISKLARALGVSVSYLFSQQGTEPAAPENGKATNGHKEFVDILLVEDNADDAELTLAAFRRSRFANMVHVVRDGQEALDYVFGRGAYADRAQPGRPQVILLDLDLPKVGGMEVLRRIKADKRTHDIPVVVVTGSQLDSDIAESQTLGAEAYIVKPVDFYRLTQVTPVLRLNWALLKPPVATAAAMAA